MYRFNVVVDIIKLIAGRGAMSIFLCGPNPDRPKGEVVTFGGSLRRTGTGEVCRRKITW